MKKILVASLFAALTVPFAFAAQTGSAPAGQSQTDTNTKKKSRSKKSHHKKGKKAGSTEPSK